MTKQQFEGKIKSGLTKTQLALINFNIFYNPEHIEYYQNYYMEEYDWCYKYLMRNKHLLDIKHTPKGKRKLARMNIQAAKRLL